MEQRETMEEKKNPRKELRPAFEKLWIWQEAHRLMLEVHKIAEKLPSHEKYKKRDQIERSSSSVADNIAEGYTSYYYNDKIKEMRVARKEAGETQNHLRALQDKGYLTRAQVDQLISDYEYLIRGINSFVSYIVKKRAGGKR